MINMSKEISTVKINLRKDIVSTITQEKKIPKSRVAVVLDRSYSMMGMYEENIVQQTLEVLFPIALEMDSNKELDMWVFSDGFYRLPTVTLDNFFGYVDSIIKPFKYGGTNYSPVMQDIYKKYVTEGPSSTPSYIIFLTDGENSDHTDAKSILIKSSFENMFYQFLGIGNATFGFLRRMDTMQGRYIDNANFQCVNDISSIPDLYLYNMLLEEYPDWLSKYKPPTSKERGQTSGGLLGRFFGR
jgi:hypothetical protein